MNNISAVNSNNVFSNNYFGNRTGSMYIKPDKKPAPLNWYERAKQDIQQDLLDLTDRAETAKDEYIGDATVQLDDFIVEMDDVRVREI